MAYAIALPYPLVKGIHAQGSSLDLSRIEDFFKDWYRWNYSKKVKLAPVKLYMHFKRNELCDVLNTSDNLDNNDIRNLARDYVKKANAPKIYSAFFNFKEKMKRLFGIETEYDILEKRLETEAKAAYFSHSYLLNEQMEDVVIAPNINRKKRLNDLEFREKYYITEQRLKGASAEELVRKCSLNDRNVVYQVMTEYHRKKGLIKKSDKKTYGKLTAEEAIEISMLNKELNMAAEAIAELKGLSGKHVVYLCNRYRREREQREKAKEMEAQAAQPAETAEQPFEIEQPYIQDITILKEPMPNYPMVSNYLH